MVAVRLQAAAEPVRAEMEGQRVVCQEQAQAEQVREVVVVRRWQQLTRNASGAGANAARRRACA